VLLLVLLSLPVVLPGCGDSKKQQAPTSGKSGAVNDISGLCPTIVGGGLAKLCAVNSRDSVVEVTIDSFDDEVARNACTDIVNKTTRLTAGLSGQWKLQVFSPYRSDKPMATCYIH
jgi:hypothetical protein